MFDRHHCGAVLVNRNWALTAAHCVPSESPNGLKLYAGSHTRSDPPSSEQESTILQIKNHPSFNDPLLWSNDISLLRIASPFTFNENVTVACEPRTEDYVNKTTTISGWGGTMSGELPTDEFRYTNVEVVAQQICSEPYPDQLDESMICAAKLGRDTCQGDSGGPLAYNRDGRFEVIGITSWGRGCALPTHPGVYAKVSHQLAWIKENAD
ncbi:unnamed protein product [Dimorphilus gyrociliatus]|nr:unnamed protein product [Dimorphilus gyrociliatus]